MNGVIIRTGEFILQGTGARRGKTFCMSMKKRGVLIWSWILQIPISCMQVCGIAFVVAGVILFLKMGTIFTKQQTEARPGRLLTKVCPIQNLPGGSASQSHIRIQMFFMPLSMIMRKNVTPRRAKLIHMKDRCKKLCSAALFTAAMIKEKPGRRWARYMIFFVHSPEPTVGCLD